MTFEDAGSPLTVADVAAAEKRLGFKLPAVVRALYLRSNGGSPSPYVYEDARVYTVVSEFLALRSDRTDGAIDAYDRLVRNKRLAPARFLPFAVDGGGDYFFVDCRTVDGRVHLYRGDTASTDNLIDLGLGFEAFWQAFKDE